MSAFVLKLIKLICSFLSYHPQRMGLPADRPRRRQAALPRGLHVLREDIPGPHDQHRVLEVGEIFNDDDMAKAMMDRIVHHGRLVTYERESYRMKHALMRDDY